MQFPTIPIRSKVAKIAVTWPKERATAGVLFNTGEKPFYRMLTDQSIASLFLEAVAANTEEAWAFVSKNYVNAIDLDALRDVLSQSGQGRWCRTQVKVSFNRDPKNCSTSSVVLVNPERNEKSLLHLHMIKEPDRFGSWKIYGVEQE